MQIYFKGEPEKRTPLKKFFAQKFLPIEDCPSFIPKDPQSGAMAGNDHTTIQYDVRIWQHCQNGRST